MARTEIHGASDMKEAPKAEYQKPRAPKPVVRKNKDDIDAAIDGLSQFCHSFCMNCAESEKQGDLIFRCDECRFNEKKTGICSVKAFIHQHGTLEQLDAATAMGSL